MNYALSQTLQLSCANLAVGRGVCISDRSACSVSGSFRSADRGVLVARFKRTGFVPEVQRSCPETGAALSSRAVEFDDSRPAFNCRGLGR